MKRTLCIMLAALLLAAIPSQAGKKAKHLLFIGIDGFSSEGLRTVNPADVPNLKFLMENGSYTLAKRSVMPSASAINWATIFMGIPTEMHCYYRWNSASPDIPAAVPMSEHGMPATIYTLVRQQKPSMKTACFYNWDGIGKVTDTLAMTSHLDYFATYGRKDYSLERYAREFGAEYILKEKPDFFTFYIDDLDGAGHGNGWCTPEYYAMMKECDKAIGILIQALKDAGIFNDTIIVVTSDHGGKDRGHGGFTILELESPYIIFGKKVKKGFEFDNPMMQYDVAATFAYILGVKTPEYWIGRPMKQVFK